MPTNDPPTLPSRPRRRSRLLIVDNDEALARAMEESLAKVGYECVVATSGPEGARKIETDTFDIVVTDLVMNDVDGMEILARARQALPDAEVILVTGHATVPKAVEAMQQGAFNFLEKPITPNRLRAVCEKAADAIRLKRQNTELRERLDERFGFEGIIYASSQMQTVIDRLKRIAPTDATVLITGESGTGKELIAQAIHQNSPRKGKRIVALNCAAVAENLVESELFGHVKGAFTDAHSDRIGAFEFANGGTLFLDEVGDMPMSTQIKLLRVLEEHQITRVGDNKPIRVNVRVVSATNRRLEELVAAGQVPQRPVFPPEGRHGQPAGPPRAARRHRSAGRSLSPPVRQAAPQADQGHVARRHQAAVSPTTGRATCGSSATPSRRWSCSTWTARSTSTTCRRSWPTPPSRSGPVAAGGGPMELIGRTMDDIERWAIEETLKLTSGNREEAAKILGIGARTLYRKLEKYQVGDDDANDKNDVNVTSMTNADTNDMTMR